MSLMKKQRMVRVPESTYRDLERLAEELGLSVQRTASLLIDKQVREVEAAGSLTLIVRRTDSDNPHSEPIIELQ